MTEIPLRHRAALRAALDELVAGGRPDLLTWVRQYGASGAELVIQPEDVWTHVWTEYGERADGTAYGVVPIWTTTESPSELSAEFEVAANGAVRLTDLHVL